ncbi:rod shape-determining protein [Pleurocapsales cyanobacterium LEGE 06147]|nr:rod shape-determining protein [Pleurocapsales cyanobacterium LEGE 06147]
MGIDLGTANTLIYVSGKGIVLEEPSVVAIDRRTEEPRAVGKEAKSMLGRAPEDVHALRPLRDGVIADFDATAIMLQEFIRRAYEGNPIVQPRMVIGIPSGVTKVERRAVMEVAAQAGAREVDLIEEPIAAAIGAGLPVTESTGNMIVDIGGGTTEVAVISSQGKVVSESIRVAGDELTASIIQYIKKKHKLVIGENMAENLKIRLGSVCSSEEGDSEENDSMVEVRGIHLVSSLPRSAQLQASEIREAMSEPINAIVDAVKITLEQTPPDLAADIIDRGILLAGGGALLKGLDVFISKETGIVTHIAAEPLKCVVLGTGRVLEDKSFERVLSDRSRLI